MAKGKWCVASERVDGGRIFRAYRTLDTGKRDEEANREYSGDWCASRRDVEALVDYLNLKEGDA